MRSLYQTKPGATFYGDSKISMVVRKDYIEYVVNFGSSIYAVVNLVILRDQLVLIIDCGSFFKKLEEVMPYIFNHKEELPALFALINGENEEYKIGFTGTPRSNNKAPSLGILRFIPYSRFENEQEITIAGRPNVINHALSILLFAQTIFKEVSESKESSISELQSAFFS